MHNFYLKLSLDLHGHATVGCRTIVKILEVFTSQIGPSFPHHTTIRQGIIRHGYHCLQKPLEKANDWITIGDLTICVGKLKCLAILGGKREINPSWRKLKITFLKTIIVRGK
jgi:hypothetical protein